MTKNGYDRFVCMRSEDYEAMQRARDETAVAKLRARMRIAKYEREHGLADDAFEATERIMKK